MEKWLLHNLDCTVEGVPIHVLMKNRESLHNIPSKKIVNWMTYKPALSQAGFMKTCERILSEHDFIRHESATFDTKYLLEEMRKLQRVQEELEHDELSGMEHNHLSWAQRMQRVSRGTGTQSGLTQPHL